MKGEAMEEMKISSSSPNNQSNEASWKVYDNPFYCSHHRHQHHQISFPVWDLTSVSDSKLDVSRAQIVGLQAELENQIKARKMAESLNQKLAKELAEQRRRREALERVCGKLALRISMEKAEIGKMERAFEEERKTLRMAQVLREKRVQKNMAEAKIVLEEKLLGLEETKRTPPPQFAADSTGVTVSSAAAVHRKASPETENPHIKRGIKGFVEFPRGVRAMNGSKTRQWGSKLECQKAQLSVLLKHKSPTRSNSIVMS
ncbi:hypothetical protein V6N11_028456 [Hibiscus sabdariffa]|uniref:Branchless trichome n=2 Tax=Hibiscus sabdariffa TaxID=183260 RepID=A0ABR2A7Q8_9ROSI